MSLSRDDLDSLAGRHKWQVVLYLTWDWEEEGKQMIRTTAAILCDLCFNQFGPTFASEYYAKRWTENWADDYLEYGLFCDDATPRFSNLFSKAGSKLICKRCTEIEIQKTKGKVTT